MDVNENIKALKRYLFLLPAQHQFVFTEDVRKSIRKILFLSVSNNGQYLDRLFPNAFTLPSALRSQDPHDIESMVHKIDTDFGWSYASYYKNSFHKRDPKFNSHNHHAFHSGTPCARIFRKGEAIYRCLTCGFDDTCALCSHCYLPEFHEGHKVHITICARENGGVCDCGDPEAWVNEFLCPYAAHDGNTISLRDAPVPPAFADNFLRTMETLLDYVIDVMTHCDLQFDNSDEITESDLIFYSDNSSLSSSMYGYDPSENVTDVNSTEFNLMIYNDQIRHYREAVQRIRLASRKVREFAVMVTEKAQNYGKATVVTSSDIGLLKERQKILAATGLATSIRSHRDIFREDMCDEILKWINDLTESEIFKTSNGIKNLFCRAYCGRWNKGLKDDPKLDKLLLYNTGYLNFFNQIPKVPTSKSDSDRNPASHRWKFQPKKWNIDPELCQLCDYNLTNEDYDPDQNHIGSRLQYFIYLDVRFWSSIRSLLHDMYSTSLITNLRYKNIISSQYVDIYPAVSDMFLVLDREPELNIMSTLSTQLFTCPSNSTSIVEHGDLSRILASIYGFLTDETIKSPQNIDVTHHLSIKSLRNRRWGQIFFDIGYILTRSRYSEIVLSPDAVAMACDLLALFQGRPVLRREGKNHVEYENTDYSAFFHAILVIYQFGEYIAHCLQNHDRDLPENTSSKLGKDAITYVYYFLLRLEHGNYPGLTDDTVDINLSPGQLQIEPIEKNYIPSFRIDSDKVSFLHPIHSFLSWLLEFSKFESLEEIRELLKLTPEHLKNQPIGINSCQTILFEYSLRTVVLMSQIKSGFWVRNGYSVRNQLQMYKNTSLRECGFMRDLFLTQLFTNLCSPNLVCFTIFNRWLLLSGWIPKKITTSELEQGIDYGYKIRELLDKRHKTQEAENTLTYDLKTLPYMVEECLNFFIHLVTEDLHLRGLNDDELGRIRIENEIIQNLCFGQMNYTKLCSFIPDHIVAEKRFDIILRELTYFTPPNTSKDVGSYRLKEEYFDRINPYYFSYSANTKDDTVKLVKEKLWGRKQTDAIIVPSLRNPKELGIYRYVGNFSVSTYFSDFIITCLYYVYEVGLEKVESLLETALHLIHICSYENNLDVEKFGTFFDVFIKGSSHSAYAEHSIAGLLHQMLFDQQFKAHHPKIRAIFLNFNSRYDVNSAMISVVDNFDVFQMVQLQSNENAENEYDRKKRIAKEKQTKLLAKFKKQQFLFIKKNKIITADVSDSEMETFDRSGWTFPETHCMLCQNTANNVGPFGIVGYVAKSSEFRSVPFDSKYWFLKAFSDGGNLDEDEFTENENQYSEKWKQYMKKIQDDNVIGPGFDDNEHVDSKLVSLSCGHGMHFRCYMNFVESNRNRQSQTTRNSPENVDHKEFLCPLCKSINNVFVPILWSNNKRALKQFLEPSEIGLNALNKLDGFETGKAVWFTEFSNNLKHSIEAFSVLTPGATRMVDEHQTNPTQLQESFKMLLDNIFKVMTLFNFPTVFKGDSALLLVNTIKSTEVSLRGVSSNETLVFKQLSNNTLINLRSLNELRNTMLYMNTHSTTEHDAYIQTLAHLKSLHSNSEFSERILSQDFFELLVTTCHIPEAGFLFNTILRACFTGHVIQCAFLIISNILSHNFYQCPEYSILDVPTISTVEKEKAETAFKLFKKIRYYLLSDNDEDMLANDPKFGYVLYSMIVKACTPFLRRSLIYAFVSCADLHGFDCEEYNSVFLEADRICAVANIESIHVLLEQFLDDSTPTYANEKFTAFFEELSSSGQFVEPSVQMDFPGIVKLIDLPERLDFFFTKYYYLDKYDNPHRTIEDPAICLFCGEVVDAQKCSVGSSLGECTTHWIKECPNSMGIFLLPKDKCVLLMHKNGGSFIEAPYLDQHGELAGESKRSKTLYLMRPRYNRLIRNIWLEHNIPNYIARKLDGVIDAGGWNTL